MATHANNLKNKDITPNGCALTDEYTIHIHSEVNDVHINCKSKDDDLGDNYLNVGEEYNFKFCMNVIGSTLFYCHFDWEGKQAQFDVFRKIDGRNPEWCKQGQGHKVNCYWDVKEDGFYIPGSFDPEPNKWYVKYDWDQ
ncbi:S-protein homolog 3-like [Rutidosis leptorrhynchoides]|uniref:S-protein homolog 3-like n=1 Tax=Rutidosis leptorrhynchoides TaxID=125765 RepID=UPI003A99CE94